MIDNANRHFRGQQKNEEVICFFREHAIVLLDPFTRFFLIVVIATISEVLLVHYAPGAAWFTRFSMLAVAVVFLFFLHRFFIHLLNYFLKIVIITNYRLIRLEKTIFLHDDKHAIDLNKIQDVTKQQKGILQTFLDYGSLAIIVNIQEAPFVINYVPKPDRYFRRINIVKHTYVLARTGGGIVEQNTVDTMQEQSSFTHLSL